MKSLKNILSKNSNFHSLNDILQESLRIGIDDKPELSPTTWDELRQIIKERFKELGPGTAKNPIDFNDVDVSGMTTFSDSRHSGIFETTKFEYIDISEWDVSNVKDMHYMFYKCHKIKSIDLSHWDVSNVKNMECMFTCCENLEFVGDLSNWDVSKVKNMNGMFSGCGQLKSIGDISNWNISNIKDMRYMFDGSGIINIPSWYEE